MNDFPNDVGHWERINDSAGPIVDRTLNLPLVVQDLCRALLDLHRETRQAKAEAWDEGFAASVNTDLGDWEHPPEEFTNPYRSDTREGNTNHGRS